MTVLWRADREQAKRHGCKALSTDDEGTLIDRMFQKAAFDIQTAYLVDEDYQPLQGRRLRDIGFRSGGILIMKFKGHLDRRDTDSHLSLR